MKDSQRKAIHAKKKKMSLQLTKGELTKQRLLESSFHSAPNTQKLKKSDRLFAYLESRIKERGLNPMKYEITTSGRIYKK